MSPSESAHEAIESLQLRMCRVAGQPEECSEIRFFNREGQDITLEVRVSLLKRGSRTYVCETSCERRVREVRAYTIHQVANHIKNMVRGIFPILWFGDQEISDHQGHVVPGAVLRIRQEIARAAWAISGHRVVGGSEVEDG